MWQFIIPIAVPIAIGLFTWVLSAHITKERKLRASISVNCFVIAVLVLVFVGAAQRISEAYDSGYLSGSRSGMQNMRVYTERVSELEDRLQVKEDEIYQLQAAGDGGAELYLQMQAIIAEKEDLRQEVIDLERLIGEYRNANVEVAQETQEPEDEVVQPGRSMALRDAFIVNSYRWGTLGVPMDSLGRSHAYTQFVTPGYRHIWSESSVDIFIDGQYSRLRGEIFAHQDMDQSASVTVQISVNRGDGWQPVHTSEPITRLTTGEHVNVSLGYNVEHVQIRLNRGQPLIFVDWEFYN